MTRIRIQPHLNHPIPTKIELLERESMIMDDDAREPIHGSRTTFGRTIIIPAQISWKDMDEAQAHDVGIREVSDGYIVCRMVDMDAILGQGKRLKRGDHIVQIGDMKDMDLYIVGELPFAHWPHLGGSRLIKYRFQDRHPMSQIGNL